MVDNPYQPGGALLDDSYVVRAADEELRESILANKSFPYFLPARQSGKSSILARARNRLGIADIRIALVDLSEFPPEALFNYGAFVEAFILEILHEIDRPAALDRAVERAKTQPRFLLESLRAILSFTGGRLVVCIDEIDRLRRCDFKDDFLGQIRAIFNRRTREATLERLQFILAGAASPEDLIGDSLQSPFNVGKEIRLEDLSREGVTKLLALGWQTPTPERDEAIERLLYWTSGSVYLCQEFFTEGIMNTSSTRKVCLCRS
jgi:AAA-like domain